MCTINTSAKAMKADHNVHNHARSFAEVSKIDKVGELFFPLSAPSHLSSNVTHRILPLAHCSESIPPT